MRGRRTWIKAVDGHRVFETKRLSVDGDAAHAAYDTTTGDIEVNVAAPDVMRRCLFHEQVHKAFAAMSAEERERIFENEDIEQAEEELCLYLEKTLYELLSHNGWLKYPNPPSSPKKRGTQ